MAPPCPPSHPQMPGDADEELAGADIKFFTVFEDAHGVKPKPPRRVVVSPPPKPSSNGCEVDRPPYDVGIPLRQLEPENRRGRVSVKS